LALISSGSPLPSPGVLSAFGPSAIMRPCPHISSRVAFSRSVVEVTLGSANELLALNSWLLPKFFGLRGRGMPLRIDRGSFLRLAVWQVRPPPSGVCATCLLAPIRVCVGQCEQILSIAILTAFLTKLSERGAANPTVLKCNLFGHSDTLALTLFYSLNEGRSF